jgi:SOS-response transcriptional repressor LexA
MPAGNAFWLLVENDSMNAASGKSVPEGMRVLVDTGLPAEPGRLVIARQPGRPAVLRQLVEEGGDKMLKPLNTRYPTILCEEGCEFIGVVVRVHGASRMPGPQSGPRTLTPPVRPAPSLR